jgi:adenylate kinase
MIIALTGTPGTGKTTTADKLKDRGFKIINIKKYIDENNLANGYDEERNSQEVDLEQLDTSLKEHTASLDRSDNIIIESHLSHNLTFLDKIIVLRCHPKKLEERLQKVGFAEKKIRENIEAEAVDVITIESVELIGKDKVFEINVTDKDPEDVAADVINIIQAENSVKTEYKVGNIDWSEVILEWY